MIFNPDHYEGTPGSPLTISAQMVLSDYWKQIAKPTLKPEFAHLYEEQQKPQSTALVLVHPAPAA